MHVVMMACAAVMAVWKLCQPALPPHACLAFVGCIVQSPQNKHTSLEDVF